MGIDYASAFSGLDDATTEDRLPKLLDKDGTHRFRIDAHKVHKGDNGLSFIAECTILKSANPDVVEGERFSIVIGGLAESVSWKKEKAQGRLKAHLAACYQLPVDSKQNWVGLAQFAGEHGVTQGATMLGQSTTTRKEGEAGKPAPKPFVEWVYGLDQESPIRQHPALKAFYDALAA